MFDKVTIFIACAGCAICAFFGYQYATVKAEKTFYEYRLSMEQKLSQAVDDRIAAEDAWREYTRQLQTVADRDRAALEAKYHELLQSVSVSNSTPLPDDGNGMHDGAKSTGADNDLSSTSGSARRTDTAKTDRQSRPSCGVYKDALTKAKKRILWEAKERDICAIHYNTLLQIYQSVSDNKER